MGYQVLCIPSWHSSVGGALLAQLSEIPTWEKILAVSRRYTQTVVSCLSHVVLLLTVQKAPHFSLLAAS
jgi:hypothetical protein